MDVALDEMRAVHPEHIADPVTARLVDQDEHVAAINRVGVEWGPVGSARSVTDVGQRRPEAPPACPGSNP